MQAETQGSVCYTERRVVQRHDLGSRVTRDRAICLCNLHTKGTTGLCQMHDGVYDVCVLTFLKLNYITALINCLCADARTHKLVYEPCHMHDWAYMQTCVHIARKHMLCGQDVCIYACMHTCPLKCPRAQILLLVCENAHSHVSLWNKNNKHSGWMRNGEICTATVMIPSVISFYNRSETSS